MVTKDGTRSATVISPFTNPTSPAPTSASSSASTSGNPAAAASCIRNGASANTLPADRSISPQISSMISPQAMMAEAAMNCDSVSRFAAERKFSLTAWKYAVSRMATTMMLASRQRRKAAAGRPQRPAGGAFFPVAAQVLMGPERGTIPSLSVLPS